MIVIKRKNTNVLNIELDDKTIGTPLNNKLEPTEGFDENIQNKRKRSKILTLNESRRRLALRADVMNKNFFRALRREAKFIFERYLISNGFSTSKSKRTFKSNLKRYTDHLLQDIKSYGINGKLNFFLNFKLFIK